MVLLQDDLVASIGIFQSFVQGAITGVPDLGLVLIADSVLHAVHGGDACIRVLVQDACIRVLDQVVYVRLRRGHLFHHGVLNGGDLHRGLLFHYNILNRSLLLFLGSFLLLGSFLCGGQFHCDGGCFRSGRLRSGLCSGLSFRLFLYRQFGFRGFLRVGLGMINGSRSLYVGCVFRGLSVGGQRGGCNTGGQGQSHGGFFEFLVRHKIRSFRSAHKRYYKLYLYGDKTEQ